MEVLRIAYKPDGNPSIAIIAHCDVNGFVLVEKDRFWMEVSSQSAVGEEQPFDVKGMCIVPIDPKAKKPSGNNLPWKKVIEMHR
jgi:hypothetical protein